MDISTFLNELFKAVLTVAVPIISAYLVGLIQSKSKAAQAGTNSVIVQDLISGAEKTVTDVVTATNQTLVDDLKKDGKFDETAAKEAFQNAKDAILKILPQTTKDALAVLYGDVDAWLDSKIEATVKNVKATTVSADNTALHLSAESNNATDTTRAAETSADTSESASAAATESK